jgi:membrane protein implicated in regulation of membrane protease activity
MSTLYLVCALVGGGLVLVQLVLGLVGLDHDAPHDLHIGSGDAHDGGHDAAHHDGAATGLNLGSLRALAAATAFFGLTGYALQRAGTASWIALVAALAAGVVALVVVALILRAMLRLESDGTVRIENALGQPATVYVPIPGERAGAGKISLSVQGRLVEYQAVTPEATLPTGAAVTVVDVVAPDTLEVVRTPTL